MAPAADRDSCRGQIQATKGRLCEAATLRPNVREKTRAPKMGQMTNSRSGLLC